MQLEKSCSQQQQNKSYNDLPSKLRKRLRAGECKCSKNNYPCIIVHGGAGNFNNHIIMEKITGCKKAAINGYKKLINGENSIDAVEAALWWLECDEFYNCSYGSVLNEKGTVIIKLFFNMKSKLIPHISMHLMQEKCKWMRV